VGPAAVVALDVGGVLGQERLAQALTGPVGQGRDGVRRHAEQGSDVGRLLALDLGVPEHQLPAFRQGRERPGRGGVLEPLDCGVAEGDAGGEGLQVVGRLGARRRTVPVDPQAPDRGEQVGAEGDVRASAALQHREHLGERVGDEVVGVGAVGELARQAAGGVDVAFVEQSVGAQISASDRRDQLGVPGLVDLAYC